VSLGVTIAQRIEGARRVGEHKTSMLQDVEAGRPLEIDCMTGALVELGERLGIPVPVTRGVHALTKLLDASARVP
jgi:2-dehydropantoate 2-reductase